MKKEKRRYRLFALLTAGMMLTCTSMAAEPTYCIGRYLVRGQMPLQIQERSFQFYWGDIQTWRESSAAYERRLHQVHRQAVAAGMLIKPPVRFGANKGMLMVTHEEGERPFDPNASLVVAYVHHSGITFEFKKRTVNRLLQVAELRAKEILESAYGVSAQSLPLKSAMSGFCVTDGLLTLVPLKGWHESALIDGSFIRNGFAYRFLLSISSVTDDKEAADLEYRRQLLLKATAGEQAFLREAQPARSAATHEGVVRILNVLRDDGKSFPVYEWRAPRSMGGSQNGLALYLYIWPADMKDGGKAGEYLVKAARAQERTDPLLLDIRLAGGGETIQPVRTATPQVEESMMPYVVRFHDRQTSAPLPGRLYRLHYNGKQVYEGRTDKNGLTYTQNVGYFETWDVVVPPVEPSKE